MRVRMVGLMLGVAIAAQLRSQPGVWTSTSSLPCRSEGSKSWSWHVVSSGLAKSRARVIMRPCARVRGVKWRICASHRQTTVALADLLSIPQASLQPKDEASQTNVECYSRASVQITAGQRFYFPAECGSVGERASDGVWRGCGTCKWRRRVATCGANPVSRIFRGY